MAKAYQDMASLAKSYEPDVERMNNQILSGIASDLERQARMLLGDINALWMGYERSYQPSVYERTRATRQGFSLSDLRMKLNADKTVTVEIDLVLDDDLMYHDSIFGEGYSQGHSFFLISEGWHSRRLETALGGRRERFTHFDGTGIIDSIVRSYNTAEYEFEFFYEGEKYA